jgi:hypothetical protein
MTAGRLGGPMAADRPAVRPPDTLKVRGRLRAAWLALWLAGAAGCVAVGLYGDTPEDTLGSHQIFLSLFLFLAAVSVVVAVRGFGRGLDADGNGVVVRNMLRAISIPWRELAAIEFKGVDSVAISDMYYQLVFQRHDGSRVTAEAPGGGARPGEYLFELPGGGARPGEYLFELRERLLAMRYAALGHSSTQATPRHQQTPSNHRNLATPRGACASRLRRWASQRTARQDHWLAEPFSPRGPSGPTRRDSRPPPFLAGLCHS